MRTDEVERRLRRVERAVAGVAAPEVHVWRNTPTDIYNQPFLTNAIRSVSAGTTRATGPEVVFSNSNGVTFGVAGQTVTASVAAGGGGGAALSAGTQSVNTGTVVFSNSNGITFGMSGSSQVTASHDGIRSISAGTTRATAPEVVFSNSNGISFGVNGQTVTAQHNALTNAVQSISAGTTRATGPEVVFSNSNGVTFGVNGQTVTASVAAGGGGGAPTISVWPGPYLLSTNTQAALHTGVSAATGGSTQWTYSAFITSVPFPHQLEFSHAAMLFSANATSSGTGSATIGFKIGVYTLDAGTRLSRLSSFQFVMEVSQNSITARTHRWYWGTNSTSNSSSLGGNVSASFSALRQVPIYGTPATLSASNYYIAAFMTQRSSSVNVYGVARMAFWSGSTTGASCLGANTITAPFGYVGIFSTTTNTNVITGAEMPASINSTAITGSGGTSQWRHPHVYMYRNS